MAVSPEFSELPQEKTLSESERRLEAHMSNWGRFQIDGVVYEEPVEKPKVPLHQQLRGMYGRSQSPFDQVNPAQRQLRQLLEGLQSES